MKNTIIVCFLLLQNYCSAQHKNIQKDTANMAQEIETFDIKTFEKNKISNRCTFLNSKGDSVNQEFRDGYYIEKTKKRDSKYSITKVFNESGNIEQKGEYYNSDLHIGKFEWFDEKGEITEIRNYDQHFTFSLEDVLNYLEENNIKEVDKSPTGHKVTITLWRTDSSKLSEEDPIVWTISYGLIPLILKNNDAVFMGVIKITLDGKTGEEINKQYKRARVDTEWQPFENLKK
ncbi:hypothetical protein ACSTS3_08430 [Aquimarina muelleri]|uniref:hypothetical protein n=1 Tax=Aquimarina muelleri TaxID=279356 RepID=UPI003F689035